MIAKFAPKKDYTTAEKFVPEKLLELFFNKTIDSQRVRLNNPFWILRELDQVCRDFSIQKIKHFDRTVVPVIHEAIELIKDDFTLEFKEIGKKYFLKLLGSSKEGQYKHLWHAVHIIIKDNNEYAKRLFDLVKSEVSLLNRKSILQPEDFVNLNLLLEYLATHLVNGGYSKGFLYRLTSKLFGYPSELVFADAFKEFSQLSTFNEEEYTVVFKLRKVAGGIREIDLMSNLEIKESELKTYLEINDKSQTFFTKRSEYTYFLAIEAKAPDNLSVIEKAKKQVFDLVDLLYLGYPDNPFEIERHCLIIKTDDPGNAEIQPVSHYADGNYKNHNLLYELLLDKISRLKRKNTLKKESVQKVVSAYRHLRIGRDANEQEQKFLNYWIGLEYLFSNYEIQESTITRLKEFFINIHSVGYFKRNLREFHSDIVRLKLGNAIPQLTDSLDYLKDEATYDFIVDNFLDAFPLLAFRAYNFREIVRDSSKAIAVMHKHRKNLEWHMTRSYRIRNEIVHDSAIHLNIESITANLKYYLTYVLNGAMEYLDNNLIDLTGDGMISLEDYFLFQQVKYNSLESLKFPIDAMLNEKSFTEIFAN